MSEQKYFVDFLQGGDNGQATVDSIQPVTDGEPGTQNVFRRPTENIRGRTEVVRDTARELLYYRDFNHLGLWGAPGNSMTWGGPTDGTPVGTGVLTQVGVLSIRPLLTPDVSTKGSLSIGTSGTNAVLYAVLPAGYTTQGLDEVTVEHRDVLGATLSATITDGPVKRILVVFDSTQTLHNAVAVTSAVNLAIAADSVLNLRFSATADGFLGNAILAQAETRVEGTADQEAHTLASGVLTTFTTANPLKNGDAVAIYYRYLVEYPITLTPGGRWESNPDRSTDTITAASLFITSNEPEKIPGSVPLFKVLNDQIVWFDGTRMEPGTTGPIGSTTSDYVLVDDSVFTGPDSVVTNGGIDNALSPNTLQEALVSIDKRLHERRDVTYVITDGAASTGGTYDSASALQDAISDLAGTGGHIYLRRGSYVLPNTYTIPADVTLEGEGLTLVTLSQAAPAALTVLSRCRLENITIDVGDIAVAVSGDTCVIDNVKVNSRLAVSGDYCNLSGLSVSVTTSASTTVSITGSHNTVNNVNITGTVSITGSYNDITGLSSLTAGISPVGLATFNCLGNYNKIDTLTIHAPTVALSNKILALLSGNFNSYTNVFVTGAAGLSNCTGVYVFGGALKLENVASSMLDGIALTIVGGTSGVLTNGLFVNNSNTDHTLTYASTVARPKFTLRNCSFSQSANTGHPLFDMNMAATLGLPTDLSFENCNFAAANLSSFAARAQNIQFTDCEFTIYNGPTLRLGGQADGQTSSIFVFNNNCQLQNCAINGSDAEVNNDGGTPTITDPLFVKLVGATATNLCLLNLNRHLNAGSGTAIGLIELGAGAKLNGLKVEFTSTAAIQGGPSVLETIVTVTGSSAEFTNYTVTGTTVLPTPATALGYSPAGNTAFISDFKMSDIQFAPTGGYGGPLLQTIYLAGYTIERCVFGSGANGAADTQGATIPNGSGTIRDVTFYARPISTAGGFKLDTNHDNVNFDNVRLRCNVAVDNTNALFNNSTAGTFRYWNFVGCNFFLNATGAGTKAFLTGGSTFSQCVGAGNIWLYVGGTPGTPSFSADINTW